jgi:hypothetical protein
MNVYQYHDSRYPPGDERDEATRWIAAPSEALAAQCAEGRGWAPSGGEIFADCGDRICDLDSMGVDVVIWERP